MSLSFLELLDFKVFSFPSPFPKDGIKGNISVVSTNTYLIAFHCIYNKGQPPQWKTILDIWEPPRIPLKNLASLKDSSSFTAWGNSGGGGAGGRWVGLEDLGGSHSFQAWVRDDQPSRTECHGGKMKNWLYAN